MLQGHYLCSTLGLFEAPKPMEGADLELESMESVKRSCSTRSRKPLRWLNCMFEAGGMRETPEERQGTHSWTCQPSSERMHQAPARVQ